MAGRIFLANVGANTQQRVKSPVFDDGTFELLPIPERRDFPASAPVVRYGDLQSFNNPGENLRPFVPKSLWRWPCHADPEFLTPTYGDDCDTSPRAYGLRCVEPGDYIFFLARLVGWRDGGFTSEAGFYLVGFLEVEEVLPSVRARPPKEVLGRLGANAHVRRALADPSFYNGFWVFRGSRRSRRFRHAVPVSPQGARRLFTAADGSPWRWDDGRTPLQVIGSYTRSCRCIIDPSRPEGAERWTSLWEMVSQYDGLSVPMGNRSEG